MNEELKPEGARYSVGIDLGTTNSVLSYVDLSRCDGEKIILEVMEVPQLIAPGEVEDKTQLPSFVYRAHEAELNEGDLALPWTPKPEAIVGVLARQLGSKTPIRLVASAKSWLCHTGVDCRAPFLPIEAPEEVERLSPFQASVYYLQHLRDTWNHKYPDAPLDQQHVILTVPASFDPLARELTADAAHQIGLQQAILLEEPQSALYSWIQKSEGGWREQAKVGDIILVVDVGGGTTDLSLIAVTEDEGNLVLNRVAVGDHILLGGDNMDLALAYVVKTKLEAEGKRLEPWQIQSLTHGCRDAKEALLNDPDIQTMPIVVPSRGSKMIGGTLRTELTREEVDRTLIEGFLPELGVEERPVTAARAGLTTIGLPYAQDARITSHLASFLSRQIKATEELQGFQQPGNATFLHPTAVLLNGGVFKAKALTDRLMKVLNRWLEAEDAPAARLLEGADLDLSVARGAAYYGYVRQGKGVRIRGGTAASYYVGVESAMPAVPGFPPPLQLLCIAPFGMEEGTESSLPPYEFGLVVGEPVRFRFFASTVRREDQAGARLEYWSDEEIEELDEIEVTLPVENRTPGEVVPVQLAAAVTEVGTLRLDAVAKKSDERWKVEFDVRAGVKAAKTEALQQEASGAFVENPVEAPAQAEMSEPEQAPAEAEAASQEESVHPEEAPQEESKEQGSAKKPFWSFKK